VRLLGSGTLLREVIAAAELLAADWDVGAEVWSVTSFSELAREARDGSAGTACTRPQAPRRSHLDAASPATRR
jgi:pyruvate dehydrogenase E1 component